MNKQKESITTKTYLQNLADIFFHTAPPRHKYLAARFFGVVNGERPTDLRRKCDFDNLIAKIGTSISDLEEGYKMSLGGDESPRKVAMREKITYDIDFLTKLRDMMTEEGVQKVMTKYSAKRKATPTKEMEELFEQISGGLRINGRR
jgi:hypothetical protein